MVKFFMDQMFTRLYQHLPRGVPPPQMDLPAPYRQGQTYGWLMWQNGCLSVIPRVTVTSIRGTMFTKVLESILCSSVTDLEKGWILIFHHQFIIRTVKLKMIYWGVRSEWQIYNLGRLSRSMSRAVATLALEHVQNQALCVQWYIFAQYTITP